MKTRHTCDYCGLTLSSPGYSPGSKKNYCDSGCYLAERILGTWGENGTATWILLRFGLGVFLAINVMMLSLVLYLSAPGDLSTSAVHGFRLVLIILSTPAVIILGAPFLSCAFNKIRKKRFDTDALIVTGVFMAYGISVWHSITGSGHIYFDTATMLLLIVTIVRLVEATAKSRASSAVKSIFSLIPDTARVVRAGIEKIIPAGDVRKGDIILVKPGERIPADGRITSGECTIEESAFTGEHRPRRCCPGDIVFSGSISCAGMISVVAMAVGEESLIVQMQHLIEQSQSGRTPIEWLTERVTSVFVPLVWAAAAGTGVYWGIIHHNPERAGLSTLAMLVVACPCALGIATPLATCIAMGKATRSGVLFCSGKVFERLQFVSHILFDKTGILTSNKLVVSDIVLYSASVTIDEVLIYATSLESESKHIIAKAIVSATQAKGCETGKVSNLKVYPSYGVSGDVSICGTKRHVTIGSLKLLKIDHELPLKLAESGDNDQSTTIYIGWRGRVQAAIRLRDSLHISAPATVASLLGMGISSAVISGDREAPTRRSAKEAGIAMSLFECTPIEKVEAIANARKIRKCPIAMVGDGINDAPALDEADIGIATGGGRDIARQSSDVTLVGNDLLRIPWVIRLSRKTYRIIRQNLVWAFGYNTVAMVLAFFGYVHPLIAATAMLASSLVVIANSLRLLPDSKI
ncbi:MAG: cation-translocating P-type ATPase [Armatimonadota bacterium]